MTADKVDHELDPDGDTILILRNPDAPFAVWVTENQWPDLLSPKATVGKKGDTSQQTPTENANDESSVHVQQQGLGDGEIVSSPKPDPQVAPTTKADVKFRVSSKHLMLASKYFYSLFNGLWKENNTNSDSNYSLYTDDWDGEALLIMLNIIHGRNRKVPRTLSLEQVARIAVIIDYYQCHEVAEAFSDGWIAEIGLYMPLIECGRETVLRFMVSWVFTQKNVFSDLSVHMQRLLRGPLDPLNLPIPEVVIDEMERKRQAIVKDLLAKVFDTFDQLCTGDIGCNHACSSMLLGAFTKKMSECGLLGLRPDAPFLGYSVETILKMKDGINEPDSRCSDFCSSELNRIEKLVSERCGKAFDKGRGIRNATLAGTELYSHDHERSRAMEIPYSFWRTKLRHSCTAGTNLRQTFETIVFVPINLEDFVSK